MGKQSETVRSAQRKCSCLNILIADKRVIKLMLHNFATDQEALCRLEGNPYAKKYTVAVLLFSLQLCDTCSRVRQVATGVVANASFQARYVSLKVYTRRRWLSAERSREFVKI